ncbi:MAG TPA: hypothetical protein VEB43_20385 [Anaeromyxobacter sp.]|nr:hypothetical protein [Anaeromyxobacter sp.]
MATTSPDGQLALAFESPDDADVELYTPAGQRQTSAPIAAVRGGSTDMESWFHWSEGGWHGITVDDPQRQTLTAWDTAGALQTSLEGYDVVHLAPDGDGGSVALATAAGGSGQAHLLWVNGDGEVTRDVLLDRAGTQAIVHPTGHVLVLASGDDEDAFARWFDDEGAPLTEWFDADFRYGGDDDPALRLLLDGRVVVHDGTGWAAAFRDGEAAVEDPPAWLVALGDRRLAALPGGKGYVALGGEPGGAAGTAELLTPEGERCGALAPPPGAPPAGGARTPFGYWLGPDGTLIEGSTVAGPSLTGSANHCAFRWWPELFAE